MDRKREARRVAILEAVEALGREHSRHATPKEVAQATGIPLRTVRDYARRLEAEGQLRRHYAGRAYERLYPADEATV